MKSDLVYFSSFQLIRIKDAPKRGSVRDWRLSNRPPAGSSSLLYDCVFGRNQRNTTTLTHTLMIKCLFIFSQFLYRLFFDIWRSLASLSLSLASFLWHFLIFCLLTTMIAWWSAHLDTSPTAVVVQYIDTSLPHRDKKRRKMMASIRGRRDRIVFNLDSLRLYLNQQSIERRYCLKELNNHKSRRKLLFVGI